MQSFSSNSKRNNSLNISESVESENGNLDSAGYKHFKQTLIIEYMNPLLQELLKEEDINQRLQNIMVAVDKYIAKLNEHLKYPQQFDAPDYPIVNGLSEKAKVALNLMIKVYSCDAFQVEKFPQIKSSQIQTCIREILFDQMNQLDSLTKKHFHSIKLFNLPNVALHLPAPIAAMVLTFLDYETYLMLYQVSNTTNKFTKSNNNFVDNIYYMHGEPMVIQVKPKSTPTAMPLAAKYEERELLATLPVGRSEYTEIYPTLYQALELSYLMRQEIGNGNNKIYFRPIWAVRFLGNTLKLDTKHFDSSLPITLGHMPAERPVSIMFAEVKKNAVIPLRVQVAYPGLFGSYTQNNSIDYNKSVANKALTDQNRSSCVIS